MTEKFSTTAHLSVAMETSAVTQTSSAAGGYSMTSGLYEIEFYFQCAVLAIGIVGTAANGLVLYALIASKQHTKHVLIVNQNAIDLFCCVFLVVCYSVKLANIYLTGSIGYFLCTIVVSETIVTCGISGSIVNLAFVTIERYLKVVHPIWTKTKLRGWMIHSAVAFTWIAPLVYQLGMVFPTSTIMDGMCLAYTIWSYENESVVWVICSFIQSYVLTVFVFIFCYWRILVVIRRQACSVVSCTPNLKQRKHAI